MEIDKLFLLNMDRPPFMPIELEIKRVLTELGYTVEDLKEGLFWVEKGKDSMFYVYASSRFPDRFSLSTVAHVPPEVEDKDDFIAEAACVARKNGAPKIYAGIWNGSCYVSQTFKRRNNKILPARLQRNIDEFFAGYRNFVSCEKLIFESYQAVSDIDEETLIQQ